MSEQINRHDPADQLDGVRSVYPNRPLETLAAWGNDQVRPGYPVAPWAEEKQGLPWKLILIVSALIIAVVGMIGGLAARDQNVLPVWVPVFGMDSGVAVCKAAAESKGAVVESSQITGTEAEKMADLRKMFSGSRYPSIRDNGVRFVDMAYQISQMSRGQDSGLGLLPMIGPLTESYAGLAGGCAEQGYQIPVMGQK